MTAWGSPRSRVPSASARSMVVCPHPNPLPEGEGTAALDGGVGVPSPSPYAAHPVDADHVPSPSSLRAPTGEGTTLRADYWALTSWPSFQTAANMSLPSSEWCRSGPNGLAG